MAVPILWRNRRQRYSLQGETCPACARAIFPPRQTCPYCSQDHAQANIRSCTQSHVASQADVLAHVMALPKHRHTVDGQSSNSHYLPASTESDPSDPIDTASYANDRRESLFFMPAHLVRSASLVLGESGDD